MAPEQFKGNVSRRSDQYSLGCIAYELLTGRPPFLETDFYALAFKHISEAPPDPTRFNPRLPEHVVGVLFRALEKDYEKRYPEALQSFQRAIQLEPTYTQARQKREMLLQKIQRG